MPTYEYKCDACGYAFERFHSMTADPIKRCPECGKAKVKRLIGTGAGLIFKGSGFYITDYRDKSYTDKAKAESGTSSSSSTSSDGKSDGKSDAKPADGAAAATAATTPASSDGKPAAKSEPAAKPQTASKSAAKPRTGGGKPKKRG